MMIKQKNKQFKKVQKGAVLLEALIAILIFSMGILAVAGLQTVMAKNTTDASYRSEASFIVQKELSEIMTNPLAARTKTQAISSLPAGNIVISEPNLGRINFVVTWQVPGQDARRYETNASINF